MYIILKKKILLNIIIIIVIIIIIYKLKNRRENCVKCQIFQNGEETSPF